MKFPFLLCALLPFIATAQAAKPPNIIFILADDLGYTDVNAFAQKATGESKDKMFYEPPNLDRLAAGGLAFSQAYAYQLCSPTRASLLTGKNAPGLGFTTATPQTALSFYALGQEAPAGYLALDARYWGDPIKTPQALLNGSTLLALPSGRKTDQGRDELTFAEALTGYRSAFIGKWHVGGHGAEGYQPRDQGFEEIAWFDAGGSPFFKWQALWDRKAKNDPAMPQKELLWGKSGGATGEDYLTDNLTTQADRFIRSHHQSKPDQPFLLYFCQFAVHSPIQAKPQDIGYFEKKTTKGWNGHRDATYAGMIRSLDQSVGIDPETLRAKHKIDGHSLVSLFKDPANKEKGYIRDTFIWHYPFNVAPLHPDDGFALTPHSAIRKGDFKLIFDWNRPPLAARHQERSSRKPEPRRIDAGENPRAFQRTQRLAGCQRRDKIPARAQSGIRSPDGHEGPPVHRSPPPIPRPRPRHPSRRG